MIIFFEVLEHQSNPDEFIKDVKKLLKKGAYIAGSVPLHKDMKPFGEGDVPPNHFLMFTKDGLEKYLKLKGFKSVRVEEVVDKSQFRGALGINSSLLRSIFALSKKDIKELSIKFRLYFLAKDLGRLMMPLIDLSVSLYRMLIGEKRAKEIEKSSLGGLYFQARL
ncbi:MAG: hypothetical protein QW035_02610 [Candidatus Anstonellales archaeon]